MRKTARVPFSVATIRWMRIERDQVQIDIADTLFSCYSSNIDLESTTSFSDFRCSPSDVCPKYALPH